MTKKDFKVFADMFIKLYKLQRKGQKITIGIVEREATKIFENDNDKFNFIKWVKYIEKGLKKND